MSVSGCLQRGEGCPTSNANKFLVSMLVFVPFDCYLMPLLVTLSEEHLFHNMTVTSRKELRKYYRI